MTEETLDDLRCYVSNCFNHCELGAFKCDRPSESSYMRLADLMIQEYDLTHNDVDNVVEDIEELVAQYIMEQSPKFTDNDE